ncbi:hypothetical protein VRU48_06680 [Pedobacter sp. KR3-3]|uniref:Uncharacterized protein n=1 Tax=Pedobacter albus TaxID=3113905 RepID=A0ABU7I6B2_9SPHI|nr:hypothetical protein [Pedobacter sp. KR3-3]MEE1944784.1 hypothetical protein [Pedobacter sp. KR3-3]
MKRVKSLVYNKFVLDINEHHPVDLFALLSEAKYTDENGMGFTRVTGDSTYVEATLLKRSFTYIQEFDPIESDLVRKQIAVFSSVNFSINSMLRLLTVYGGQIQLNMVRTMLRNVQGLKYNAEPILLNAREFNETLIDKKVNSSIRQLTIRRFNYENGMIGRFSGEVVKQSTARELLEHYKSSVVKVVFGVLIEQEELLVQILPNGNVKLLCDEDDFEYYLDYLKQIIFS